MSSRKVPVAQAPPLASNPFAALQMDGLPPGEYALPAENRESKAPRGRVVLRREKSRRGGKTVIVVSDFAPHFLLHDLEDLARRAKQTCGCGGTVAGREIELQGQDATRVREFFEREGFRVAGI